MTSPSHPANTSSHRCPICQYVVGQQVRLRSGSSLPTISTTAIPSGQTVGIHTPPEPLQDRAAASPPAVPFPPRRHWKTFPEGPQHLSPPGLLTLCIPTFCPSPLPGRASVPSGPACPVLLLPKLWWLRAGLSPHGPLRAPCEAAGGRCQLCTFSTGSSLAASPDSVPHPPPQVPLVLKELAPLPRSAANRGQSHTMENSTACERVAFSVASCADQPPLLAWKFLKGGNRIISFSQYTNLAKSCLPSGCVYATSPLQSLGISWQDLMGGCLSCHSHTLIEH